MKNAEDLDRRRFGGVTRAVTLAALAAASLATPALADDHGAQNEQAEEQYPMTPQGAADWVAMVEKDLFDYTAWSSQVYWVNATYITHDTEALAAQAGAEGTEKSVKYALEAAKYAEVEGLDPEVARKLDILRNGIVMPAPVRDGAATELNEIATKLGSAYGKGKGTLNGEEINGSDIEAEMGNLERTPAELAEMWTSWHDNVGAPMREDYQRMIAIANEGSKELGFADLGAMWRSNYDMDPDQFAAETERMWQEVKPLYMALHTYVRGKLNAKYGAEVQPATGPIRADLLGNMWAQEWGNIYPLVAPEGAGDLGYDIGELLEEQGKGPLDMVKIGEGFYSSLGFEPLPETFWERSMFTKPADREVVCHASAWDVDNKDDIRIKMCIKVNADDFVTIHHELGHNYYQRAYQQQSPLHRTSANDGFHEGIGDTIALSITPEYLAEVGLLRRVPPADRDLGLLLRLALDKVAFLPFGLMVDQWRWKVFSGEIGPEEYNEGWWDLRTEYQGIRAPMPRSEADFDPGAKYHIPANTSYTRYFLAHILQFQFHRALCEVAGVEGPLHRCSIFGSLEAGARLNTMLAMGASRPWPDALEVVTGQREMDATAILDYFAPVQAWLDEQNAGRSCGW